MNQKTVILLMVKTRLYNSLYITPDYKYSFICYHVDIARTQVDLESRCRVDKYNRLRQFCSEFVF